MAGTLLALAACLCFGVLNFIGPLEGRRVPLLTLVFVSQAIATAALLAFIVIAGLSPPSLAGVALGLACGLINVAALVLQYQASRHGPIGVISVIIAIGVAIPVAVGLLAGERPGPAQLVGLLLGLAGAAMATLGDNRAFAPASAPATAIDPPPAPDRGRWILPTAVSSLLFGTFLVLFATASEENLPWAMLTTRVSMAAAALVVGLIIAPYLLVPRTRLIALGALGLLMVAATGLYAGAATVGLLSVASVLTAASPVVTVVLAWSLLGEKLSTIQALGVVVAVVGLALIVA